MTTIGRTADGSQTRRTDRCWWSVNVETIRDAELNTYELTCTHIHTYTHILLYTTSSRPDRNYTYTYYPDNSAIPSVFPLVIHSLNIPRDRQYPTIIPYLSSSSTISLRPSVCVYVRVSTLHLRLWDSPIIITHRVTHSLCVYVCVLLLQLLFLIRSI